MEFVIENLSKSYGKKEVLKNVSFSFEQGKIYGLLGRNGAGKTTLFNCLNRDIKTDSGEFFLRSQAERMPVRPEDLGYVLSTPTVPEFLTGREFLRFFLDIHKDTFPSEKELDACFEIVRLAPEDRDRLMKDYSHGMKNKMQMLINILASPKVLLLDEPLTSLDVVVAEDMKQLLRQIKTDKVILLSTHLLDLALDLCDEIVLLSHGELERVEKTDMDRAEFRERILQALREDDND